jgi:archaeal type IV pilus assembly protein PilA
MKHLAGRCHIKMRYKKFLNNSKAISPIFATLILIAIAVIAGVVVYMFTSGTLATMTGGGTAAQEKMSIQAVQGSAADGFTVYAQSTTGTITLDSAIIKTSDGAVNATYTFSTTTPVTVGSTLATLGPYVPTTDLVSGNVYTVTLVSTKGGNFVSPSFTATA